MLNIKIGSKSSQKNQPSPKPAREPETSPEITMDALPKVTEGQEHLEMIKQEALSQSPEPSAAPSGTSSPASEPPTHFDDLLKPSAAGAAAPSGPGAGSQPPAPGMMTRDEFRENFIGMHKLGTMATGIQALTIPNSHIDKPTANQVADTFYETILDIPMLHFMLKPGNKWLGRGMVILLYADGMKNAIAEERRGRRDEKGQNVNDQAKPNFSRAKEAASNPPSGGYPDADQRAALTGR